MKANLIQKWEETGNNIGTEDIVWSTSSCDK